jgi:hypothetical protein
MIKLKRNIILFSISVFLLISCTSSQYIEPKQLDAETSAKSILSNNIKDQKLIAYLSRYNLFIPDKDDYWNSDLLIMIALYNNKNLEMKRVEYGLVAADIQVITAGFKNNILNPTIEYHTKGKPFTIGLSLEVHTNNISIKKIKLDLIKIKTLTKALEIILPAWEIRTNVMKSIAKILKYEEEYILENNITNKMDKNLNIMNGLYEQGLISSILLNNYKKDLEERISNLKIIKSKIKASRINLSSNLNLPIDLIMSMKIALEDSKTATIEELESTLEEKLNFALVSRGDVLTSLSKYAESESELRLLVAEENNIIQSLSPAILWDQTDLIFNLTGALLLKNEEITDAKMNKAILKRDLYKASFEATQSMILQEVYNSFSKMLIVNAEYYAGLSLLQNSKLNLEMIINRRKKGDVSNLDVLQAELLTLQREKLLSDIKYNRLFSFLDFENSLGHSYNNKDYLPKDAYYPIDYFTNSYKGNSQ